MKTLSILLLAAVLFAGCSNKQERKPITMDELMIQVFDTTRDVAYTNKQAGYLYTETNAPHHTSWQGWHIMSAKMLDDYQILINGKPLNRREVQITQVFPHQFIRTYKIGLRERVTLLDSINAIVVELDRIKSKQVEVRPLFSQPESEYLVHGAGGKVTVAMQHHLSRTEKENFPVWVGVSIASSAPVTDTVKSKVGIYSAIGGINGDVADDKTTIIFSAGDTEDQAKSILSLAATDFSERIAARKARMERLVNDSYLRTNDKRLTMALNWSKLSLDALIMNQVKKGIFAGLPWFDNYWGRDSYISLPGAAIVTGNYSEAKEILRSFATWQDKDMSSPTAGRIPNIVTTVSMAYNTTDGTPRFASALEMYVLYSGDTAFAREMYPTISTAIEGAVKHHVDSLSFMTHLDAETWMDAVGPEGPWSPRGNRASDIQYLWFQELQSAISLARFTGDTASAERWSRVLSNINSNFNRCYVDSVNGIVTDHLNADGTRDTQNRPNQIFTIPMIGSKEVQARVFRHVTETLVYPWGLASLAQEDDNFHPYHHYAPYYVQDAAYHNGTVWTWLYGAWVDAAAGFGQQNIAFQVTDNMAHQILDRGAVGTLSELTDALPRPGKSEPELSGTFSQAWSLAEFNRSFYQGYLGCTVDAVNGFIRLAPNLPTAITDVEFTIPYGSERIAAEYHLKNGFGTILLHSPSTAKDIAVYLSIMESDGKKLTSKAILPHGLLTTITVKSDKFSASSGSTSQDLNVITSKAELTADFFAGMKLATPKLRENLKALKGPDYTVLHLEDVKADPTKAVSILEADDVAGDDNGGGGYVYPTNVNLKPGSLDITHLSVKKDDKNAYFTLTFRTLSNPGWHPEYGFQLTYALIAIDEDGKPGSGSVSPGMNSLYLLDPNRAFEHAIYVGGGFRVTNSAGKVLAEYLPAPEDIRNTLGSTENKSVSFSIPLSILGTPTSAWRYTVLVGAQDDHGGAGVGDFRAVAKVAAEWNGGGKSNPNAPNVYDVLVAGK